MKHLMPANIRAFEESDIVIAADIAEQASQFPWTEAVFRDCMKAQYHAWILELDRPIGFLVLLDQVHECELLNICVLPEYQRQGYGQQLLTHAMVHAEGEHLQRIFLEVRASNRAAINLYRSAGFVEIGLRENYYPAKEGREDAILMIWGVG